MLKRFEMKEEKVNEVASNFSGSAALQVLQNDHTFILDLLVRESIQNSSDAVLEDEPVFSVSFNTGIFRNHNLARCFDERTEAKLIERFPANCSYMEIRDTHTSGLTGETMLSKRNNDTKSHFLRLVFDMGKGQDKENAGGNWGYGKTVYYRLGKGIVAYYSRIKLLDDNYESRLIVTVVEDETRTDALLRTDENVSTGRAWWGAKNGSDLCPITDEKIIDEFLSTFGIRPFSDDETGTSIIIPYIDEAALMKEAKSGFKVDDETVLSRCTFLTSVSEYLKYAIQKWYAPIINNHGLMAYGRKFLNAYVNNNEHPITKGDLYPVFSLVQELYNSAYARIAGKTHQSKYPISIAESQGRSRGGHPLYKLGYIAFVKISLNDLYGTESLLPPNVYMNVSDADYKCVVSLYTRDLGMILNYDEAWVAPHEIAIGPDELVVTLYVPSTKETIPSDVGPILLGEYLRKREEADHLKWDDDPSKMPLKFVKQIKLSVAHAVKGYYAPEQQETYEQSGLSVFARPLGEKLFPKKKPKPKITGGGSGNGSGVVKKEKNFIFSTKASGITSSGSFKVDFLLEFKAATSVIIKTEITADTTVDSKKWREKIGTTYPLRIANFDVTFQEETDGSIIIQEVDGEVMVSGEKNKLIGSFEIQASDRKLAFVIDCVEKKEDDTK